MIVSKSSWHYRLYTWTKSQWSDDFNKQPDLCSYISTMLLQTPLFATVNVVFWLPSKFFEGVGKFKDYADQSGKHFAIAMAGLIALISMIAMGIALYVGAALGEFMFEMLKFWGFMLGCAVGVVAMGIVIFGVIPWLFDKSKAKGASFVELIKTWVNDGAGKRFCRTLTFVD